MLNAVHRQSMYLNSPNPSQEGTKVHDDQSTVLAVQLTLPVTYVCSFHIGVHVVHYMLEDAWQCGWDFCRHSIILKGVEHLRSV